jgi:hypothetical protein
MGKFSIQHQAVTTSDKIKHHPDRSRLVKITLKSSDLDVLITVSELVKISIKKVCHSYFSWCKERSLSPSPKHWFIQPIFTDATIK